MTPRLQFTGERMLPWVDDPALAYEHLHRYAFARALAGGRRVLDLGCGEGYGSALLAAAAESVVGVDIDPEAVAHASEAYPELRFETASADDLSAFADDAFDLVVCFEVIEHVEAQEQVLREVARVLAPGGRLLCSTPERERYRERTGDENPFHVRELDQAEFEALLSGAFAHHRLWSQVTVTGSLLEPMEAAAAAASVVHVRWAEQRWELSERPEPLYLVALASDDDLDAGELSVLVDPGLRLFEQQRHRAETAERTLHEHRLERAEAEERLQGYKAGMELREGEVRELSAKADGLREELLAAGEAAAERARELARIQGSPAWKAVEAARRRLSHDNGTPNAAGRAARGALRAADRLRHWGG